MAPFAGINTELGTLRDFRTITKSGSCKASYDSWSTVADISAGADLERSQRFATHSLCLRALVSLNIKQ